MPTHTQLPFVDTHPITNHYDLDKPAPFFNTSLAMWPGFKHFVQELCHDYGFRQAETIQSMLLFCATAVPEKQVRDFMKLQRERVDNGRTREALMGAQRP